MWAVNKPVLFSSNSYVHYNLVLPGNGPHSVQNLIDREERLGAGHRKHRFSFTIPSWPYQLTYQASNQHSYKAYCLRPTDTEV